MEGYSVAYFPHNLGEISSIIDATDFSVKKITVLTTVRTQLQQWLVILIRVGKDGKLFDTWVCLSTHA
jgi:hypothetical protein